MKKIKYFNKRKRLKSIFIYNQQDINKILYKLDFYDIIKEYIVLNKSGKDYVGKCPFCKTKTYNNKHFRVSEIKKIYKCFICGAGGTNVISFLMRYYNKPFGDILLFVNKKYVKIELKIERIRSIKKGTNIDENLPF